MAKNYLNSNSIFYNESDSGIFSCARFPPKNSNLMHNDKQFQNLKVKTAKCTMCLRAPEYTGCSIWIGVILRGKFGKSLDDIKIKVTI